MYVAVLGPQTVFFDSRNRSFCALHSSWVYCLREVVHEWGITESRDSQADTNGSPSEYAGYLADRGLLTTVPAEGKRMEQLQFETAQIGLVEQTACSQMRVGPRRTARILCSALAAVWKFHCWTFDKLLEDLAPGRRAHLKKQARPSAQQVSELVSAYWHLRPLLPFDRYTDFLDSLTLIEYLSNYIVFPRLVIGVRLMPFTTHTWVQEGTTVFNDSPEFVRQYTPIFST